MFSLITYIIKIMIYKYIIIYNNILQYTTIYYNMKYLLFMISSFIVIFLENMRTFGNLDYASFKKFISYMYWFGTKILGWNINNFLKLSNNEDIPDNFVVISNHINYIDVVIIPYLLITEFPDHKLIFITRHKYSKLPYVGKYMLNHHILIKNNLNEDLNNIRTILTSFINKNQKTITLIFPEGTFMANDTIEASNKWCAKLGIQPYTRCLAPRINGIFSVLNIIKPDKILETSIIYTDNISNNKGTEHKHLLYDFFPQYSCVYMKFINNDFNLEDKKEFENKFYTYWRNTYDYTNILS